MRGAQPRPCAVLEVQGPARVIAVWTAPARGGPTGMKSYGSPTRVWTASYLGDPPRGIDYFSEPPKRFSRTERPALRGHRASPTYSTGPDPGQVVGAKDWSLSSAVSTDPMIGSR